MTEEVELIPIPAESNKAIYCPFNDRIYVTHSQYSIISVINPQENVVEKVINSGVGQGVHGIVYAPVINKILVTNHKNDTNSQGSVSVLDPQTNTFSDTMAVDTYPTDIIHNLKNDMIYVSNYSAENMWFIKNL